MKNSIKLCSLLLIIFIGCQNFDKSESKTKKETVIKTKQDKPNSKEVFFKRNSQSENFIFLDFWYKMNQNEFIVIRDSLIKKGNLFARGDTIVFELDLETASYSDSSEKEICKVFFELKPVFFNGSLTNVNLILKDIENPIFTDIIDPRKDGTITAILQLFKRKYGKPKMPKRNSDKHIWIKNNKVIEITEIYTEVFKDFWYPDFPEKYKIKLDSYTISYYSKDFYDIIHEIENNKKNEYNRNIKRKASETIENI